MNIQMDKAWAGKGRISIQKLFFDQRHLIVAVAHLPVDARIAERLEHGLENSPAGCPSGSGRRR
ncbi:hypothetical protein [Nitrospina gracilis]|uniref:hypothetical protein n=1 Tax=Nitrospina gracilis TaxID=35801 RepID=UPI0003452D98|nr:hypothetical protein [Nitrospina gracilis]